MFTKQFAQQVGIRMIAIVAILIGASFIAAYAASTDTLWLLALLPLACTIPPSIHNVHPKEMRIDHGRIKGTVLAIVLVVPKFLVMCCVVFGGAVLLVALALIYSATTCYFFGNYICVIPIQ